MEFVIAVALLCVTAYLVVGQALNYAQNASGSRALTFKQALDAINDLSNSLRSITVNPEITVNLHPVPPTIAEPDDSDLPSLPREIALFISQESEQWYREELVRKAYKLWRDFGADKQAWDQVHVALQNEVSTERVGW